MEKVYSEMEIIENPNKFTFGKIETIDESKINELKEEMKRNNLNPIAIDKCDKVYHLYFFGKVSDIENVCKVAYDKGAFVCGRVVKSSLGSLNCSIEELK